MPKSNAPQEVNWLPEIILAMRHHGRSATLTELYRWVEHQRTNLPVEYQAVVRSTIYAHSSDSSAYVAGNPDIFCQVSHGEWGLRRIDNPTTASRASAVPLVLQQMTDEELRPFVGHPDAFKRELKARADTFQLKRALAAGSIR